MGYARPIYHESIKYSFLKLYGKFKMYFTCATYIMVIEVPDLKSQVWFPTKIAWHKVQLPLYYIHLEITQLQDLVSSNILLIQYWTGLKLNSSILGRWGGGGKFEFWKQKLQNLPHDALCLSFSYSLIGYFKKALKCDWLFCF